MPARLSLAPACQVRCNRLPGGRSWLRLTRLALLVGLLPLASRAQLGTAANFSTGTTSGPQGVVTPDVNGDGKPDMVTANFNISKIGVFLNTTATNATTPTFSAITSFSGTTGNYPYNLATADINQDGKPDILSASLGNTTGGIDVLLNTTAAGATTPSFAAPVNLLMSTKTSYAAAVADVNGDGKPDMVGLNLGGTTTAAPTYADVFLNTTLANATMPTFATKASVPLTSSSKELDCLTLADVNGDGKPDLLASNTTDNTVLVSLNTTATNASTATFGAVASYSTGTNSTPYYLATGDVNQDGKPDILASNNSTSVVGVFLNTTATNAATSSFAAQVTFSAGSNTGPGGIRTTDVNGDGKPDAVVGLNNTGQVGVLLNTTAANATTPSFGAVTAYSLGSSSAAPYDIAVADINRDGKPDVLTANNGTNNASVLLNQYIYPVPTVTSLSPTSGAVGTSVTVTGTGFSSTTGVKFNGTAATYTVNSATSLTATVPTGASTGNVAVTTLGGTSASSSASAFTVSAPLPVELVAFSVTADGPVARLAWTTASELRSAAFEVQASPTGADFHTVGRVAAAGTSVQPRAYAFADAALPTYGSPQVYYRLRQLDQNGTATYSPARVVAAPAPGLAAYPNPARGYLVVVRPSPVTALAQLRNACGQVVRELALPTTETRLDLAGLPGGVYTLTLPGQPPVRCLLAE